MKISVLTPKSEFTKTQQNTLSNLGEVVYTDSRREYPTKELIQLISGSDILAIDPDNLGGFEIAPKRLLQIFKQTPTLRGLALSTTSYGYFDRKYCQDRGIKVTNVPHYSTQSVAELAISMLLGCAKHIFRTDRETQRGEYHLHMGQEVSGKTLGIIGLGSIGQKTAEIAKGLGMKVFAWNRSKKTIKGIRSVSLSRLLSESDIISLHLADTPETVEFFGAKQLIQCKRGVIIINVSSRDLVNEKDMAKILKSGQVASYMLEAEGFDNSPLSGLENVYMFKGFGWYTKEAIARNKEIWVKNIVSMVKGSPLNLVV
jgi:phosphoglycerate dehydrogenase-like enzyme